MSWSLRKVAGALVAVALSPVVLVSLAWTALARPWTRWAGRRPSLGIVVVSQVPWDEVWQRPHELAMRLGREHRTIFVSPVQVHRWLFTLKGRWRPFRLPEQSPGLLVLSPLVFPGSYKLKWILHLNSWVEQLTLLLALGGAERWSVCTNSPFAMPAIRALFWRGGTPGQRLYRLVYDLIDDFTAFDWSPAYSKPMDAWLIANAHSVVTGTAELCDEVLRSRPDAEFIPCGVDFEMFHDADVEVPADVAVLPRPIIGYFGSITDRLDMALVGRVAREFPEASVVLVGPVHLDPGMLPRAENLHYLGLRPHPALPAYARAFSVGLIPFHLNEANRKLNPVKTLEYLAAGLPVVAVALPDLKRFYAGVVRLAGDHEEFVEGVRCALRDAAGHDPGRGEAMARAASWDAMTERFVARLAPPGDAAQPEPLAASDGAAGAVR